MKGLFPSSSDSEPISIVNRTEWGAAPAKSVEHFEGPAPYVIIHHSYVPEACYNPGSCQKAMRSMQSFHQDDRGWNDIGYTFGIGGDGKIYEGRGFNVIGAHAPQYNNRSVGICLIGDWTSECLIGFTNYDKKSDLTSFYSFSEELPPQKMLDSAKRLIEHGLTEGQISSNYVLLGHRQVRNTECPGEILFSEISSWPHFSSDPEDRASNNIPV